MVIDWEGLKWQSKGEQDRQAREMPPVEPDGGAHQVPETKTLPSINLDSL